MAPDPLNPLNSQTLYCNELDRWILNNKVVMERWQLSRGICKIYAIFTYQNRYRLQCSTGFVIKIAGQKFIASCLNVCLVSEDAPNYKKFIEQGRPLILCSFGNVDLTQEIHTFMAE